MNNEPKFRDAILVQASTEEELKKALNAPEDDIPVLGISRIGRVTVIGEHHYERSLRPQDAESFKSILDGIDQDTIVIVEAKRVGKTGLFPQPQESYMEEVERTANNKGCPVFQLDADIEIPLFEAAEMPLTEEQYLVLSGIQFARAHEINNSLVDMVTSLRTRDTLSPRARAFIKYHDIWYSSVEADRIRQLYHIKMLSMLYNEFHKEVRDRWFQNEVLRIQGENPGKKIIVVVGDGHRPHVVSALETRIAGAPVNPFLYQRLLVELENFDQYAPPPVVFGGIILS